MTEAEKKRPNDFPQIKESMFVIVMWNGKSWPEVGRLVHYLTDMKAKEGNRLWSTWDKALTYKSKGEAEKMIEAEQKLRKKLNIKDFTGVAMSIKELKKKVKWGYVE